MAVKDADGDRLDGAKTYRMTLPPDIPAARFWSVTLYDNETRSMLADTAALPAGREPVLPDTGGDRRTPTGRRPSRSAPSGPSDSPEGNWIQTDGGQGLVPDPAPLQPARVVLRQVLAAERDRARQLAVTRMADGRGRSQAASHVSAA